eukprot:12311751-Alexandrium_andersonii.AAC.1
MHQQRTCAFHFSFRPARVQKPGHEFPPGVVCVGSPEGGAQHGHVLLEQMYSEMCNLRNARYCMRRCSLFVACLCVFPATIESSHSESRLAALRSPS